MASYGFVSTSSTSKPKATTKGDPYANTQSTGGGNSAKASDWGTGDPYAGTASTGGASTTSAFNYTPTKFNAVNSDGSMAAGGGYTPKAAPTFNMAGNVAIPKEGYGSSAMRDWNQNTLAGQIAMNNQTNAQNELAFNAWAKGQELGLNSYNIGQQAAQGWAGLGLEQQLAQEQANQFGMTFNRDTQQWEKSFNQDVYEANRRFGLDTTSEANKFALGKEENRIREAYNTGQLELGKLTQKQNYELGVARNAIDQEYNQGRLTLQERDIEMARLAQIENNARMTAQNEATARYQMGQLGEQRYATDTGAQISREQMQNAYRTAIMNAVGRNQAQNVRFLRG